MVKHSELMNLREEEIAGIIEHLSVQTKGFDDPKTVLIGGYALRAFTSFSRYTRDCDFVLPKSDSWNLDRIQKQLPEDMSIQAFEKRGSYGFLRCVKLLRAGAKISVDFMEGEVRGRTDAQVFYVTEEFMQRTNRVKITIARETLEMHVPDYADYLILKFMSARPSDVRDIATLVWKNGVPVDIKKRASETLTHPEILAENLRAILADISDRRFLDSWKGTFVTTEFTERAKEEVLTKLKTLS